MFKYSDSTFFIQSLWGISYVNNILTIASIANPFYDSSGLKFILCGYKYKELNKSQFERTLIENLKVKEIDTISKYLNTSNLFKYYDIGGHSSPFKLDSIPIEFIGQKINTTYGNLVYSYKSTLNNKIEYFDLIPYFGYYYEFPVNETTELNFFLGDSFIMKSTLSKWPFNN